MKPIRNVPGGLLIISGLVAALNFLHAQEAAMPDQSIQTATATDAMLQAAESLPTIPATDAPQAGTFWSAQHAPGTGSEWPPMPTNIRNVPLWDLGDGVYLLDDLQVNYSQPVKSKTTVRSGGGMQAMDLSPPDDGGDTNDEGGFTNNFQAHIYTTNDLWLQIIACTNHTASLVIHPPWNVTNGVYDLHYCTNLDAPIAWQWLLRTEPGQTNLVVANATDAQGFYRLGPPNDLPLANDSLGTNFWVAFFNMYNPASANDFSLYISSPVGATGTVTIPGFGITNAFSVAAGAVTNISIPSDAMIPDYDAVENYGINVIASQPVSVYALNYDPYDSATFTCYPTPLLGTNYCVMAYTGYGGDSQSEFAVVATADDTTVTITPSASANLDGHTSSYTETLQQGQTYQINDGSVGDDLTGTWITSDKPVGVFAGSSLAFVPDRNVYFANPLVQEQMPVDSWGTNVLALSFPERTNGDTYRVLAAYSNTVVTISGMMVTIVDDKESPAIVTTNYETVVITNQAGQFYQTNIDGPVVFQGSKPIQVAQFANGSLFDHPDTVKGDPCEILLLPTGRWLETNTVFIPTNLDPNSGLIAFDENYLNIIVAQSAITNTLVDGSHIAATNFVAIGTNGYFGAQLSVTNGAHTVSSSQPMEVQVYGFGQEDAYGYFGGRVR